MRDAEDGLCQMKSSYPETSGKSLSTLVKSFDINGLSEDFRRCQKMSYPSEAGSLTKVSGESNFLKAAGIRVSRNQRTGRR